VASFLDARAQQGRWLVRVEDLDRERIVPGASDTMLRTLEAFGLDWDGSIEYQSARTAHYTQALARLTARGLTFPCSCSRRELTDAAGYPGTCRAGAKAAGPTAIRFRVDAGAMRFEDRLQGACDYDLATLGDVIVRRRDGAFAYQLAVVVDDALQGVTQVVRGADLLDSTPWQIALQQALQYESPTYAHLPLVTEPSGEKLAKSRRAVALDPGRAATQLCAVLQLLRQAPPAELELQLPRQILAWAIRHWNPDTVRGVRTLPVT
jgi:glutamyl-Q tRNA(Asp) synthetase